VAVGLVLQPPGTLNIPIHASSHVCIGILYVSAFIQQPVSLIRPEMFRMSELSDDPELQSYSQAILYTFSAVAHPPESIEAIGVCFINAISSSTV
jgi:hypothetical protein